MSARVVGALVILFLLMDAAGKLLRLAPYVVGTARVGHPPTSVVPLGALLLTITIPCAVALTAALGALLLTGYLDGATATHVRLGESFAFPVTLGIDVWGCLYLRDARLRSLPPSFALIALPP